LLWANGLYGEQRITEKDIRAGQIHE